jgi:hypothetical protein
MSISDSDGRTEQDNQGELGSVEPGSGSAIRSHQSYAPQVHAICHHSGQYLTRDETYPKWNNPLREQHDFPGFRELDDAFARAAHAQNHQHRVWSRTAITGLTLTISSLLLLFMVWRVLTQRDQVTTDVTEFVLFYALVIVSAVVGVGLLLRGAWLLVNGKMVYHRRAIQRNEPPEIFDFPLLCCTYEIAALEDVVVDLGNDRPLSLEERIKAPRGQVNINLFPDATSQEHCKTYLERYAQHRAGNELYIQAGTLALEHAGGIDFGDQMHEPVEFGHRIVMGGPAPRSFMQGTYIKESGPLITLTVPYTVRPRTRFQEHDERQRFALECLPKLQIGDSYTLELHFRWCGSSNQPFFLDECRLHIPLELGTVVRVERGYFDAQQREVIWRNLAFQSKKSNSGDTLSSHKGVSTNSAGESALDEDRSHGDGAEQILVLCVSFSRPSLECQRILKGSYHCSFDGLISGMNIKPEHIWNACGLKVIEDEKERIPIIQHLTTIQGTITVNTRQLSQRHEIVHTHSVTCPTAPNQILVDKIVRALILSDIDLLRIEQAASRLDPAGGLRTRLRYWEIAGRRYSLSTFDSVDVHVVISGSEKTMQEQPDEHTQIDLRVRCTHDPRNATPPQYARVQLDALVDKLRQTGIGSGSGNRVCEAAGCLCVTLDQNNAEWLLLVTNISDQKVINITIDLNPQEDMYVDPQSIRLPALRAAESWRTNLALSKVKDVDGSVIAEQTDIYTFYERGLRELQKQLLNSPRHQEFLIYEQRLRENIQHSRQYGDDETLRSDRAVVNDRLDELAQYELNISFNELCKSPSLSQIHRLNPVGLSNESWIEKQNDLEEKISWAKEKLVILKQEAINGNPQLEQPVEDLKNDLKQYEQEKRKEFNITLAFMAKYVPEKSDEQKSFRGELSVLASFEDNFAGKEAATTGDTVNQEPAPA